MRLMALDYGFATVGVAVSDELGIAAMPLETIVRKNKKKLRKTLARIEDIIHERKTELIVLGKPLNMDGSEGDMVKSCSEFKEMLEKRCRLPVVWQDERLSSREAREILVAGGIKERHEIKKNIDSIAAAIILKEYMAISGK